MYFCWRVGGRENISHKKSSNSSQLIQASQSSKSFSFKTSFALQSACAHHTSRFWTKVIGQHIAKCIFSQRLICHTLKNELFWMLLFLWFWLTCCVKVHFKSMKCYKILVISITCLHLILPLDVAERAFSRCVATNKGKAQLKNEKEVHDHSRKLEVEFNYEFLEDFQDKQSSDFLAKLHSLPAMSMSTPHRRFWTQDNDQHIAKAAWLTTTASSR